MPQERVGTNRGHLKGSPVWSSPSATECCRAPPVWSLLLLRACHTVVDFESEAPGFGAVGFSLAVSGSKV